MSTAIRIYPTDIRKYANGDPKCAGCGKPAHYVITKYIRLRETPTTRYECGSWRCQQI